MLVLVPETTVARPRALLWRQLSIAKQATMQLGVLKDGRTLKRLMWSTSAFGKRWMCRTFVAAVRASHTEHQNASLPSSFSSSVNAWKQSSSLSIVLPLKRDENPLPAPTALPIHTAGPPITVAFWHWKTFLKV